MKTIDYTHIFNELNNASLFDLYRLRVAIDKEIANPQRLLTIKKNLRVGMTLSYFDSTENRLMDAKLVELKKKNVIALNIEKQKMLSIPYYMLNSDFTDIALHEGSQTLTANHLSKGDRVGFNHHGTYVVGIIQRLNANTVTLRTTTGAQWRVAYAYLRRVHDSDIVTMSLPTQTLRLP